MPNNPNPTSLSDLSTEMFYFDGSTGCKRCQAVTGYYPTLPSKPHPHCQCSVTRHRIAKRPPCTIQYVRPKKTHRKQGRSFKETIVNCNGTDKKPLTVLLPISASHSLDPNLVKACNFTPPTALTSPSAKVVVDPGKTGKAEFFIMSKHYTLSVQRIRVCTQNGRTTKTKMSPLTGTYSIDVGIAVTDFDQTSCSAPLPRFQNP